VRKSLATRMRAWLYFGLLSHLFVSPNALAARTTLPDISRPQTGGEWAQVYTPVGEILGGAGTQPYMDEVKIHRPGAQILIDANLLEKLKQTEMLTFATVTLDDPGHLGLKLPDSDATNAPASNAWTLERFNRVAENLVTQSEAQHRVCRISFTSDADHIDQKPALIIHVKPLTVQSIKVEGNRYFKASAIQRQLGLKSGSLLDTKLIEKRVRLLQDNPDISVETTLEPVELDHAAVVHIKVDDHLPMHLSGFWSNLDQTFYGNHLSGVSYVLNNATGNGDSVMATAITDPRAHGVYTHYEIPLNSHGTRFGVDYSYLRANPIGDDFSPFKIRGRVWSLTSTLNQTLIARENLRASADANFDVRQIHTVSRRALFDTDGDGVNELYRNATIERERLRDLRVGIQLQKVSDKQEFSTRQEVTVGLPIMGATLNDKGNLANFGGGSQFFKYLGTFYYLRNLPHSLVGVVSGTAQWTPGTLPSTDVGGLGGTYFGRGYPEGLVQADSLVFVSSELRMPLFIVPKQWKIPATEDAIRDKVRLLTFVDYGFAKVNDRALVEDPTEHILSVGVGVRFELSKYLSGRCDLGIPLLKQAEPINHYGPRIHFGLQANVL
jgi:hemolysin activation/secretion protein